MSNNTHGAEGQGCSRRLIVLEQREGVLKSTSVDLWHRMQMQCKGSGLSAVLLGPVDKENPSLQLSGPGVIHHACDERLRRYDPRLYRRIIGELFEEGGFSELLFADTALSRDLAPALSVRLGASLLSRCSALPEAGRCHRRLYSGAAEGTFVASSPRAIVTVSPSSILLQPATVFLPDILPLAVPAAAHDDLPSIVRQVVRREGMVDVAEAGVVVAGGRGMGSAEGFALLEELASLFGGAVGASRTVVDEGWRPHGEQIGQTGKSIAPRLYIACGISGAVQHLSGISGAGTVVAINRDSHAPIFEVADFGLVGDVGEVLPEFVAALKEFLKMQ
ncbi:electron transfer flavoprotein subunit alpha/FixB family protein [Chlorobium phaeovibrioides]|uniref:Electron transfer flavoprotein subunit alpha/FixB family protein n=1 Tax=Chlorobium phaeovibrioides TaxID=1094 RepID=A0ABW9URP0_CHLPH|nr:electron transfer flavoprotein subunit alpha/FixB family protein [Chlorobium phaeovibrioides]MWV54359.1 electron transfer flavoprotein subunit alpha/FixB family protein [Chlorobium phaeovibrioides]RTY35752.1 electron transfer flavoprotein subunit alpha/FixB family protein [Chlorobium phaeovibrioides]